MSRSKPFDLVTFLFKPVWESEYKEPYRGTSRDLKEAKEFLAMNEAIFDDIPEFQEHALEYLHSKWDGWSELRHPCYAFLRNYNTFAPKKIKQKHQSKDTIRLIRCSDCQTEHESDKLCPKCYPKLEGDRDSALKGIASLGNSVNAKGE